MAWSRFAPAFTRFAVRYGAGRRVRKRKTATYPLTCGARRMPWTDRLVHREGMGTPPAPAYVLNVPWPSRRRARAGSSWRAHQ